MIIFLIFAISFMTAGLSLFIKKCFESGMIFRRWYLYLTYWWIKWHKKKDRRKRPILKVLGLCIYCFSTWVAIFFCSVFISINPLIIFLFIGVNYIWLEILMKIIK